MILLVESNPVLNGAMENFIQDLGDRVGLVSVAALTVIILLPFVS